MSGFRLQVGTQLSRLEGGATTDLLRKHACLTAFDFEAAARLGSWTSFGDLIEVHSVKGHAKSQLNLYRRLRNAATQRYTMSWLT